MGALLPTDDAKIVQYVMGEERKERIGKYLDLRYLLLVNVAMDAIKKRKERKKKEEKNLMVE